MADPAAPGKVNVLPVPVIGFSFSINLGLDSTFVLQTHVAEDAPRSKLFQQVNALAEQGERMRKRFALPEIERQLKLDRGQLEDAQRAVAKLDLAAQAKQEIYARDKKRTEYKEDDRTASARVNALSNIETLVERIAVNTKLQAEFTKAAYDDGSDLGTDLRAGA